jgi:hypothetical protein
MSDLVARLLCVGVCATTTKKKPQLFIVIHWLRSRACHESRQIQESRALSKRRKVMIPQNVHVLLREAPPVRVGGVTEP